MIKYRVTIIRNGETSVKDDFKTETEARSYADTKEKEIYNWFKEIDKNIPFRGKFKTDADKLAYKKETHLYRTSSDCKCKIIYEKIDFDTMYFYGKTKKA